MPRTFFMRLLHYLEIENFKRFAGKQRIELDHPAVLIGPNNCGKTSAIQALALWSQALRTWLDARTQSKAKERPGTPLNRLNIVSVPVQRTRYFWHNTHVRTGNTDIPLVITVGVMFQNQVRPVSIRFRNQGDELVYCTPADDCIGSPDLLAHAAGIRVELLYPMSGLEIEEPILQPGRIDVLLGQGQTAQVLRNLCLIVFRNSSDDWSRVQSLLQRLFSVELDVPRETPRGAIELHYRQHGVKEPLDVSLSGRGFQQLLLIFAYLYSHKRSVLMVDEPDAHLEILRQKQVYVLLRDIARENSSQVILVTHSEVILDEALDKNLSVLLGGRVENLTAKAQIRNTLRHFGAAHYVKARDRGYVLYLEGSTDLDMLRALAKLLDHPVMQVWDERVNVFYVQNNFPDQNVDAELERVEGGFGITPRDHYFGLLGILPGLRGLGILDNDGKGRRPFAESGLNVVYWKRYEAENYFITPELLRLYALNCFGEPNLFNGFANEIDDTLADLSRERLFDGRIEDFEVFRNSPPDAARLVWETKTAQVKLSDFAEEFFRRLSFRTGGPMLLTKGELHALVAFADRNAISPDVVQKLDLLEELFRSAPEFAQISPALL